MPRLRQVPLKDASPRVAEFYKMLFGDRDPVASPGTATGTPGNWWTVFALAPHIFDHAVAQFGMFGMWGDKNVSTLDPKIREIALLRTGFVVGSQFVFSQHCKAARKLGVREDQMSAIPSWSTSDKFSSLERAVLAYTDCLVLQQGRVPDDTFKALKAELSDERILELSYYIMNYNLNAVLTKALKLEYDDVPERIVEVPVPAGGGLAQDWAGKAWSKNQ